MFDTLRNSPVIQTELVYWQRKQLSRNRWRTGLFYGGLAGLGIFSFCTGVLSLLVDFPTPEMIRWLLAIYYLLLTFFHFGLILRTLSLSSAAVERERRSSERWETLVLTGVSAQEIIFAKWWVVVLIMWREYLFLALLRAAAAISERLIPGLLLGFVSYYTRPPLQFFDTVGVLIGLGSVIGVTLANLPYTAACGVMSSMDSKRGSGVIRAFAARAAFLLLTALLPTIFASFVGLYALQSLGLLSLTQFIDVQNFLGNYATLLVDNGINFATDWISPQFGTAMFALPHIIAYLFALMVYTLLTWALLRFAQWRAEGSGALRTNEASVK